MTPLRSLFAAVLFALAVYPAAGQELVSTRCHESEVVIDATHNAATLDGCGDPDAANLLWHLDRIDQRDGILDGQYRRHNAGSGVVVYIMDTGVMAAHAEFATPAGSRVIAGFDATQAVTVGASTCASPNKALMPCFSTATELTGASHGTSVASLVAGKNVGVAPEALIVSVRVMNESALATTRTYLEGLNDIIAHAWDPSTPQFHTAVVNISGWVLERLNANRDDAPVTFAAVERKIRDMIGGVDALGRPDTNGKRFLFVVAGNNVDNGCGRAGIVDRFPAILGKDLDGLITVGGMTSDNSWWPGACHGGLEILAPSQGIFSASITATNHYRGTKPNLRSGTSFAAPIIAGIAARLLAARPNLTPAELEAIITSTPSRIVNPDASRADGKVAFVQDAPAVMTASHAIATSVVRLEP
ncbi:MAG TPA: S8 family serine peptidase [Thermoanaerobaculia bacterium]|nr:S8 family serine peptidase [Thermoanaerobaculia bacterium]